VKLRSDVICHRFETSLRTVVRDHYSSAIDSRFHKRYLWSLISLFLSFLALVGWLK